MRALVVRVLRFQRRLVRRAIVLGQLLPGLVSVFQPVEAAPEIVGTPYVVFAGNVGDEQTLAYVIDLFRGRS
jgi:uncharacterized protein YgbK (DUF1537 family)